MIVSNQEVAVHLKVIRNLSHYTTGKYQLRIALLTADPKAPPATPLTLIEKEHSPCDNRSECDQQSFITRSFPLKSGAYVEINEVYLFKVDSPIGSSIESALTLKCQLFQVENNDEKLANSFSAVIAGSLAHDYLEVDFYENTPCQIIGSVHRCQYRFQFGDMQQTLDLKEFCDKHCKQNSIQVLDFLSRQSARHYECIEEHFRAITKNETISPVSPPTLKQSRIVLKIKDNFERETLMTQADQEYPDPMLEVKKRRKKIFSTSKEHRIERYQSIEKTLHHNAQKIYTLWRELIGKLFSSEAESFLTVKKREHRQNLQKKIGQSVSRFQGLWDTDSFSEEAASRNCLSSKLRNPAPHLKHEDDLQELLKITNEAFFSDTRPVFFQEKATKGGLEAFSESPEEILIILVHGLGACRLDMQKLRVEMRRYYEGKVRVFSSSTNQGRTEGDIESMGMRLAAQIEYELGKYLKVPKVCLLGHSMGGLIIRSALPRLEKYKKHFHSFVSFSSPHLGYSYSKSRLVDVGLWFLNTMKKCTSIMQMTMQDSQCLEETYLYKLSQKPGLGWFKKVVFVASHQDHYVPFHSARIQHNEQSLLDRRKGLGKAIVYNQMIHNLLGQVERPIIRLDVNFCIPQKNIDTIIGRAAHISFITNVEMGRMLVLAGKHYFY